MTPEERKTIIDAAQAIVDRWDSPAWKYGDPHTGVLIRDLERAIAPLRAEPETREPKVMTDEDMEHRALRWSCDHDQSIFTYSQSLAAFGKYLRDHGYLSPLDRPHTGYTATECSDIARKRYADEPRKTFQQQQYAQGLEDGYGHALFEHIGK